MCQGSKLLFFVLNYFGTSTLDVCLAKSKFYMSLRAGKPVTEATFPPQVQQRFKYTNHTTLEFTPKVWIYGLFSYNVYPAYQQLVTLITLLYNVTVVYNARRVQHGTISDCPPLHQEHVVTEHTGHITECQQAKYGEYLIFSQALDIFT